MTLALTLPPGPAETGRRLARRWGRPLLALALVVAAYRTSLATLVESMRLDTPLAHLALVPFISLALAYAARNNSSGPPIHDRQLDWIVGLPLGLIALVANFVLPARLSSEFWLWRVDLLTLPLFVAAIVSLLFGVRTLWKYRLAVGFLFLAWPVPFTWVLDRWLGRLTEATVGALNWTLHHITWATKVPGADALFQVDSNGVPVQMSVASACSGANGMVGFVLVASAFLLVVKGNRWLKLTWLLTGALLVWVLNVGRILVIFWAARKWGERVAIDGFHPYVGLVVFNIAVLVMVLTMRLFGLRFRRAEPLDPAETAAAGAGATKARTAMACSALLALGIGAFNGELREYDKVATSLGSPRLAAFAESRDTPEGWMLTEVGEFEWTKRFFGSGSHWIRYQFLSDPSVDAPLRATVPITVDVVETGDRASLNAYGIEECYQFHGYDIRGTQSVDLGGGVIGSALTWASDDTGLTWTTLYWHWPIKTKDGTRYERVTLVMVDNETNEFTSPPLSTSGARQLQLDLNDALRGTGSPEDRDRLIATRQFMIGFARELVSLRAEA